MGRVNPPSGGDDWTIYETLPDDSEITVSTDCQTSCFRSQHHHGAHASVIPMAPPLPEKNGHVFTTRSSAIIQADIHSPANGAIPTKVDTSMEGDLQIGHKVDIPEQDLNEYLAPTNDPPSDTDTGYSTADDKMVGYSVIAPPIDSLEGVGKCEDVKEKPRDLTSVLDDKDVQFEFSSL